MVQINVISSTLSYCQLFIVPFNNNNNIRTVNNQNKRKNVKPYQHFSLLMCYHVVASSDTATLNFPLLTEGWPELPRHGKGTEKKDTKKSPLNLMSRIMHCPPLKCHLEMSAGQWTNMVKSLNITAILHGFIFYLKAHACYLKWIYLSVQYYNGFLG